ncbi:hypothetical protein B9Q06_05075 [Candidatus Marsarchaeota G2 archaeon ECH_B_2]|jgi:hypothetical protein|uniref:Uncharacterized protein n=3 Tax=Candidatus Marsarchaeota group 2 TaxID=2203771 RepID=A0A2R6BAE2_9ARCH|nr:MAG: hypothetical protein B9Q06_05075 [Candidatus Marsarchaeota G2 archaeon ECH_B_2]PSO00096.1 MAG: hypothetical protein B9Q07_05125 [Candidatus Marsarchaeota G2 archaeon ECH_B_3]PSO02190.1 MAG: hypothetical protein B9Q05_05715 [Candidatus Marsarchaeota G2 archaeon ECH_B_1]
MFSKLRGILKRELHEQGNTTFLRVYNAAHKCFGLGYGSECLKDTTFYRAHTDSKLYDDLNAYPILLSKAGLTPPPCLIRLGVVETHPKSASLSLKAAEQARRKDDKESYTILAGVAHTL